LKLILPFVLIVLMSWGVFWVSPTQVGPKIGMSTTSMLTLIAFQFATGNLLPKLSYFTIMDEFIAACTVLVFLALLGSLTSSHLGSNKRERLALRLDKGCRWVFPIVFAFIVGVVFI